ncbi:MAG: bifunctional ADP-heptose synthase, partial [Cytophagales bacterium]|nr:bifunctional ADP-heptose synthase [Cytophagales bacterium]
DAFNALKVLIIGDVMLDTYIWGKVERISPEAPVPVVQVVKRENRLGGAANVALNVQALGAMPILCSVIGADTRAEHFCQLMYDTKIAATGIVKHPERSTIVKERVIAGSQHILRIDTESTHPLHSEQEESFLTLIKKYLPQVDVVIFQDYDKGCLTPRVIKEVIHDACKAGIPTVVDPKKQNFFSYENATLFKPNLKELKEGLNISLATTDKEALACTVRNLRERLKVAMALVTLSEQGVYIDSAHESHAIPAQIRDVADVSGAGDTVVSIAALSLALNLPAKLMATLANLGGGLVCEHLGVVSIHKKQLMQEALANNTHTLIKDVAQ